VILPDANLLLYATDRESPFHKRASRWWLSALRGDEPIGLCPPTIFAYVRLATHPKVFLQPLSVEKAFAYIENWRQFPAVQWLDSDDAHLHRVKSLLLEAGAAGDLVTDAQIAAFAIQYGATVWSADLDFGRFSKVRWRNPLLRD
jgi:toxin-antitoxin system PIN domain toxin